MMEEREAIWRWSTIKSWIIGEGYLNVGTKFNALKSTELNQNVNIVLLLNFHLKGSNIKKKRSNCGNFIYHSSLRRDGSKVVSPFSSQS